MDINNLVSVLFGLGGISALIGVLINVGKKAKVVKNGTAQNWSTGLNLAALVALYVFQVLGPDKVPFSLEEADATAQTLAVAITAVVELFLMLGGSKAVHKLLKGVPLVGFSYG